MRPTVLAITLVLSTACTANLSRSLTLGGGDSSDDESTSSADPSGAGGGDGGGGDDTPAHRQRWNEKRYQGRVPARYFDNGQMDSSEEELAHVVEWLDESCGIQPKVTIDWGSYRGEWDYEWNPYGMISSCRQFVEEINSQCRDGHTSRLDQITEIRCRFDANAEVDTKWSSPDMYLPTLDFDDEVASVGFHKNTHYRQSHVLAKLGVGQPPRSR